MRKPVRFNRKVEQRVDLGNDEKNTNVWALAHPMLTMKLIFGGVVE